MTETLQVIEGGGVRPPSVRDFAMVFFRHGRLMKLSFLLVFAAGMAYWVIAPSYQVQMKVLVRRGRIDPAVTPTETVSPLLEQDLVSEEELNSQAEMLQDDDILRKVVTETGLAERHSFIATLTHQSQEERIAHAVKRLAGKLEVVPVRKSQLISITYKSSDPKLSVAVLRSLAGAYLAKQAEVHRPNGQQAFFEGQMQKARLSLDQAQNDLLHFTDTQNVSSAGLERDLTLQRLSEAEAADLGLKAEVAESVERVRSLESKLRELPATRVVQTRNTDNPQLQEKLKSKLLELELRRTDLLTKFQPSYRLVTEVEEQIAQAQAAIKAEEARPLRDETTQEDPDHEWANSERIKSLVELQAIERREAVTQGQVRQYRDAAQRLAQDVVTQSDLEGRVKAAQEKYLLYVNKREEARIGDALDQTGILNVTLAEQPHLPALPTTPLWLATCLSLVAACGCSAGAAFTADYADPTVRTPDEVNKLLGSPILAALPARGQTSPGTRGKA